MYGDQIERVVPFGSRARGHRDRGDASCYDLAMSTARVTPWTLEAFLSWVAKQEGRYEFDGFAPVAMTGGTARHNRIAISILVALRSRLRGTPCSVFGQDLGVRTIGDAVRFPDALVACTRFPDSDRLASDVRVVFEVLSPDSGRRDRVVKMREYAAVPSILHYVIVEFAYPGLQDFHRQDGADGWSATPLKEDDILPLPGIGIEIPVAEIYEGVEFEDDATAE
jgi:Uma2 family endonuclease